MGDESPEYYCRLDMSTDRLLDPETGVKTRTTRHITTSIMYDYMITKNVMVTVNPKIVM